MSILTSLNLSILLGDGIASLPKQVTGLSFTGINGTYSQPLTVGTSPFSVPLPQSPAQVVYVRNLAPAGLSTPAQPALAQSVAGALAGTTYFIRIAYVNASGETLASTEESLAVLSNNVLTVKSPPALGSATGWNAYVSSTTGTETKQNTSLIAIGTDWTEPTTGLIAGSALPSSNTTATVLTVTWTPQGGTSAKSLDLLPQAAIVFCEPTSTGGFSGPAATGGITALSLQASAAGCSCEVIVGG